MIFLNEKQRACLDAISAHREKSGEMPTIEELRVALGVSSTSMVYRLLKSLEERRVIERRRYEPRAIVLTNEKCPHCGLTPEAAKAARKAS